MITNLYVGNEFVNDRPVYLGDVDSFKGFKVIHNYISCTELILEEYAATLITEEPFKHTNNIVKLKLFALL